MVRPHTADNSYSLYKESKIKELNDLCNDSYELLQRKKIQNINKTITSYSPFVFIPLKEFQKQSNTIMNMIKNKKETRIHNNRNKIINTYTNTKESLINIVIFI